LCCLFVTCPSAICPTLRQMGSGVTCLNQRGDSPSVSQEGEDNDRSGKSFQVIYLARGDFSLLMIFSSYGRGPRIIRISPSLSICSYEAGATTDVTTRALARGGGKAPWGSLGSGEQGWRWRKPYALLWWPVRSLMDTPSES